MIDDSYINRFRPTTFDQVVGHDAAVRSLKTALEKKTTRMFMFSGDPGLGKTTLARIVAEAAGCAENMVEVNAATKTGIDAMREVTDNLRFKPLGGKAVAVIVDEAHALSKPASQSLLKDLEEPPEWVYWFLCTSEPTRLPKALRTRCLHIELKPVPKKVLEEWAFALEDEHKLLSKKLSGDDRSDAVALCVEEAGGSPRQVLANLALIAGAESFEEAEKLIGSAEGSVEAVELARLLSRPARWSDVQATLRKLKDHDPESVRRVVQAWISSMVLNSKKEADAGRGLEILDAFSQPFYHMSGLVLASGKVVFGNE